MGFAVLAAPLIALVEREPTLGVMLVLTLAALLSFIVLRAIQAAQRADDMFGLLMASGIAVWFGFQSFVNIGMTIGIMPITGLPSRSSRTGGSAIFADKIAIGHLNSVRRHHPLHLTHPPLTPPPAGLRFLPH